VDVNAVIGEKDSILEKKSVLAHLVRENEKNVHALETALGFAEMGAGVAWH
jgi:hypothetical protein